MHVISVNPFFFTEDGDEFSQGTHLQDVEGRPGAAADEDEEGAGDPVLVGGSMGGGASTAGVASRPYEVDDRPFVQCHHERPSECHDRPGNFCYSSYLSDLHPFYPVGFNHLHAYVSTMSVCVIMFTKFKIGFCDKSERKQ